MTVSRLASSPMTLGLSEIPNPRWPSATPTAFRGDYVHIIHPPYRSWDGAGLPCVAAESLGREWVGIDLSPKAVELVRHRLADVHGAFGRIVARTDVPRRTDMGKLPHYRTHKTTLYGQQGGDCAGCGEHFKPQHLEVDHIIDRKRGGTDHAENLQLLCGHCNKVKGDRGLAYLRTKLQLAA